MICAVSAIILFLTSWAICCALRSTNEAVIVEKPVPPKEEDNVDFDDKEKMPFINLIVLIIREVLFKNKN